MRSSDENSVCLSLCPSICLSDCLTAFKFGTEFHHFTSVILQIFKVKGKRSRSWVKGQVYSINYCISSKNAIIRRHQTWHGIVIKAEKDWRGVGQPHVAMHLQLARFLVTIFHQKFVEMIPDEIIAYSVLFINRNT